MEKTLQDLVGILINAIPTALLFVVLSIVFRYILFGPLRKVLKQREELTAGARKAAEASLASAERKVQEYEAKLREARAEVYKEQDETRRKWLADQAAQAADARIKAEASIKQAREGIAAEVIAARQSVMETSTGLADQIASSLLTRRSQ